MKEMESSVASVRRGEKRRRERREEERGAVKEIVKQGEGKRKGKEEKRKRVVFIPLAFGCLNGNISQELVSKYDLIYFIHSSITNVVK